MRRQPPPRPEAWTQTNSGPGTSGWAPEAADAPTRRGGDVLAGPPPTCQLPYLTIDASEKAQRAPATPQSRATPPLVSRVHGLWDGVIASEQYAASRCVAFAAISPAVAFLRQSRYHRLGAQARRRTSASAPARGGRRGGRCGGTRRVRARAHGCASLTGRGRGGLRAVARDRSRTAGRLCRGSPR